jgi:hypothetical protein
MNQNKKSYILRIRSDTAYPAYRSLVGVIEILGYIGVVIWLLVTLVASKQGIIGALAVGVLVSVVAVVMIRFFKEASLMFADIADTLAESGFVATSRSTVGPKKDVE